MDARGRLSKNLYDPRFGASLGRKPVGKTSMMSPCPNQPP
mgnify:CR=1 FL=1